MDDADAAALYVGDVAVSAAAAAPPLPSPVAVPSPAVHALALGLEDADELLRRHVALAEVSHAATPVAIPAATTAAVAAATPAAIPATTAAATATTAAALPATLPTVPGAHPPASMSAVYRFYEIEATLSLKRREESSIAKCRLCRDEGRQERKGCVRFSKSVTSNLWRHLKENHPSVYDQHVGEKKTLQMHKSVGAGKRGRKRKGPETGPATTTAATTPTPSQAPSSATAASEPSVEDEGDDSAPSDLPVAGAGRKAAKRGRRASPASAAATSDQFFTDYALSMSATDATPAAPLAVATPHVHGAGAPSSDKRTISLDRVRDAAAYMCVHDLAPFELCASLAFRSLLTECHVSPALVDDATALATALGTQAIALQAKKLIDDVKARVAAQLKAVDGVHLQVIEWAPAAYDDEVPPTQAVGVFAVALDQEFNVVRRCLCVVPIDARSDALGNQLEQSESFSQALSIIAPHKHVPNLVVVEPSRRSQFASVLTTNKLEVLESITSLLRDIMVSTITGAPFTHPFMVGSEFSAEELSPASFQRAFDSSRFAEATPTSDAAPLAELIEAEMPSGILTELPNVLTGHTIRDILLKVLHLVAHIKQSTTTRRVMRAIMVGEFELEADAFVQVFERGPGAINISVRAIYEVLTLTLKMTPTLQRYFELHKDGTSDLSKLMQLASLSAYEWERVGYLSSLLKPFADAVAKLQEEKYVTSSLIIPSVYTLLEKLRSPVDGGPASELPEDMVALKHVAYAQLSSTFGYLFVEPADDWPSQQRSSFNWLWSATLLDPRTRPFIIKGALTQAQFWEVVKVEASEIAGMNKVKDKDNGLSDLPDHPIALEDHDANGADETTNGSHANGTDEPTGDLWDDLQANLTSCAQEEMLLASSKSALELTKSNNLLEVEISFLQDESRISLKASPLDWWQSMRVKYPYVARLARYVLSVPGSPAREENPVLHDPGLIRRLLSQMIVKDASDLVTASLNLRLEKQAQVEAAPRQLWSTV